MPTKHEISSLPFSVRAELPHTPPMTSYLLHLISIKRSTLCVSADVHNTSALLRLAEEVGDSICVLKTHVDIIDDFSERTIKGLNEISRRKHFLLFEDRKFGDIGSRLTHAGYDQCPYNILIEVDRYTPKPICPWPPKNRHVGPYHQRSSSSGPCHHPGASISCHSGFGLP